MQIQHQAKHKSTPQIPTQIPSLIQRMVVLEQKRTKEVHRIAEKGHVGL